MIDYMSKNFNITPWIHLSLRFVTFSKVGFLLPSCSHLTSHPGQVSFTIPKFLGLSFLSYFSTILHDKVNSLFWSKHREKKILYHIKKPVRCLCWSAGVYSLPHFAPGLGDEKTLAHILYHAYESVHWRSKSECVTWNERSGRNIKHPQNTPGSLRVLFKVRIMYNGGAACTERRKNPIWFNLIKISERKKTG